MKKSIYLFAATLFVGGTIFTGCTQSSEKVENAKENVLEEKQDLEQAKLDYVAAIQDFKNETNEKISTNEKKISECKAKEAHEKKEMGNDRKKRIAALEQKNTDMRRRMDDYKYNDNEGWETFKREFNHDMDELGASVNDLTVNNKN